MSNNALDVVEDPDDVVVELIGGCHGQDLVLRAFSSPEACRDGKQGADCPAWQ
ncbi:MAG: hypothetical protein R3E89_00870 [Thiolinea sp.]